MCVPIVVLDPKSHVVLLVVALVVVDIVHSRVLVLVGRSCVLVEALMSQLSHICCNCVVLVVVQDQVLSFVAEEVVVVVVVVLEVV